MENGTVLKTEYRFSGPAGEHQRAGNSSALITELGDNYERYHAELVDELAQFRPRPEMSDFDGDFTAYTEANRKQHAVYTAEAGLRYAYTLRKKGREALPDLHLTRLIDDDEQLVDFRNPPPQKKASGTPTAAPVPAPDGSTDGSWRLQPLPKPGR